MGFEIAIFVLIAGFAVISGINDGGNLMATFLASGTIAPKWVVPLIVVSIGIGPVVFGTAVSHMIAVEIVDFSAASQSVLLVSLLACLATLAMTWRLRMPTSTTIALGGGMIGTTIVSGHINLIHWSGVAKLLIGLVCSVGLGFLVAFIIAKVLWMILRRLSMRSVRVIERFQFITVFWQGLAYGANDQEKVIGLMTIFWMLVHHETRYQVPFVAILLSLAFWLLGLMFGSLRIARTVGQHIIRIKPMIALCTQTAAALTVSVAALVGFPVSTTQTVDGSLLGTGSAVEPLSVNWTVVRKMAAIWMMTMPVAIAIGAIIMAATRLIH